MRIIIIVTEIIIIIIIIITIGIVFEIGKASIYCMNNKNPN